MTEYDTKHVGHKQLNGIHIRGSSIKEEIDLNQKLIVFFLHDENLWYWKESFGDSSNTIKKVNKDTEIVRCQSIQSVDNNKFFYQVEPRRDLLAKD